MTTIPLLDAAKRRDEAIERVANHADALDPEWSDRAYASLIKFCCLYRVPFIAEEVRHWAEGLSLISPPHDARAWGAIIKRAAKDELIIKVGYAPAKSSNLSPKVQWQVAA